MTTRHLSILISGVTGVLLTAAATSAQSVPTRQICTVDSQGGLSLSTTVSEINASYESGQWDTLDRTLDALVLALAPQTQCGDEPLPTSANFVFVWGWNDVPRSYALHDVAARRPRTYMPAAAREARWFEIKLGRTEADVRRLVTTWGATSAAPSGVDLSTWLQTVATFAVPAAAAIFPARFEVRAAPTEPAREGLFVGITRLTTDIVPAKVTLTASANRAPRDMAPLASQWGSQAVGVYGDTAAAGQLIAAYQKGFSAIQCGEPGACVEDAHEVIRTTWQMSDCRADPDCQSVTADARRWADGLAARGAQTRQNTLGVEKPKRWAIGAFLGYANYGDDVRTGEAVRVRAGADNRLSRDPFGTAVSSFVAGWSLQPREPGFWGRSLASVSPYGGVVITPNIGATLGLQYRVWRQIGIGAGAMWLRYTTGEVGSVLSTSEPLQRDTLLAWTWGVTFMTDVR